MSSENESILGFPVLHGGMRDGQNEQRSRSWRIVSIACLMVLMSGFLANAAAAETTRESGPAVGMTWGLIKGTGMMAATEVIGLWEVMTCPFATPPDYTPILDPEFPWQRFTNREENRSARKVRTATAGGRRVRE